MPNNISNNSASRQKKWGSGSISVARRSSRAAASDEIDFGHSNDFIEDNDDEDENLFESIGRELDKFKGEDDVHESKGVDEDRDKNEMDNDIIHDEELEVPTEAVVNGKLSISNADANVEHESNAVRKSAESVHNTTSSTGNNDNHLNIQHANVINNSTSQNINDNEHCAAQSTKRKPRGGSSIMKTKLSPPRFSFQSHSSSAKPKSIKSIKSSTYKTPSNKKSSLPSRELFSTSAMPQHKSTIKRSIQKSSGTNSSMLSTTQKRKRHSFRPSNSNAASTPAVNNNNVREMGFVPTFLSNAKSGGGSGANASPKDVPADDDDNEDNNNFNHSTNNRDVFSKNMVTNFQQQQRQARKSESSSNTKSGYLVQRLRSLRNTDQRMAMRLRSGQYSSSSSSAAGISSSATTTGFTARKRRRSGGDHLDPKNAASSILDVTVSSKITSYSERSGNASLLSEGKSVLPAYIHCYTAMKQPSSGQQSEQCKGMLTNFPCYAWIVMSHDMMREQNVIMEEGDTGTTTKQLRLYDAVVIPPRAVNTNEQRRSELDDQVNQNHNLSCIQMPTIICTHICQEYPAEQPPLQDVSFDQFN